MIQSTEVPSELETLLCALRTVHGFDFTGYERRSLARRVHHRMGVVGIATLPDYCARLQADPAESACLLDALLVHVTTFFRDPGAWAFLAAHVVPRILGAVRSRAQVRVWSAGCASGEEALSLAMLLAEAMGIDDFTRRVKIYATDRDLTTLARARRAQYSAARIESLPGDLASKYFVASAHGVEPTPVLRRAITFGQLDLVQDPPISRLDLLVCRNTLMYLDASTQAGVLAGFASALEPGGVLFLGGAELPSFSSPALFEPLSLQHHIFTRAGSTCHTSSQETATTAHTGWA